MVVVVVVDVVVIPVCGGCPSEVAPGDANNVRCCHLHDRSYVLSLISAYQRILVGLYTSAQQLIGLMCRNSDGVGIAIKGNKNSSGDEIANVLVNDDIAHT